MATPAQAAATTVGGEVADDFRGNDRSPFLQIAGILVARRNLARGIAY
ncbi:hypothetical protein [Tsukamurella soli]